MNSGYTRPPNNNSTTPLIPKPNNNNNNNNNGGKGSYVPPMGNTNYKLFDPINKRTNVKYTQLPNTINRKKYTNLGLGILAKLDALSQSISSAPKNEIKNQLTDIVKQIQGIRKEFARDLYSRISNGVAGTQFSYGKINNSTDIKTFNKVNTNTINRYTKIISEAHNNNKPLNRVSVYPPIMQMDKFLLNYNKTAVNTIPRVNTTNINNAIKAARNAIGTPNQASPAPKRSSWFPSWMKK